MGKEAARHLFAYVAVPLALYAISLWSLSQGGNSLQAIPGLDFGAPLASLYFGIFFVGGLLCLAALLATVHARWTTDPNESRFPIIGVGDAKIVSVKAFSTRALVACLLILTLLVPSAALIHLNRKLAGSPIWNEALPSMAQMNVACAMPGLWPFGKCELDNATRDALNGARLIENGQAADTGRLWLANARCDIAWHMGMAGPKLTELQTKSLAAGAPYLLSEREGKARDELAKQGPEVAALIEKLIGPPPLANTANAATICAMPGDQSKTCKDDQSRCRGVEWDRDWSPALIIVPTLAGWLATAWFLIVELLWKTRPGRKKP